MIDWVTAIIPCSNLNISRLNDGHICRINVDGKVEWSREIGKTIPGSYDSNIRISSYPISSGMHIKVDGNPIKWLQGHNLFGSNDLVGLVYSVLIRLSDIWEFKPCEKDLDSWRGGLYRVTRVDCADMWEFRCMEDVTSWLSAAQFQSKSRHGRPITTGGTLYFGKHSRRYSLKFYCKGEEIMARGHRISPDLPNNEKLIRFSKNKLRYELVLRRPKLEELELDYAGAWNIKTPNILLRSFLKKLDLADQFRLTGEKYRFLKPRLQVVFEAWKSGTDLKAVLAKNTFYRYRREILKHGVDIGIPRNNPDKDLIPIRNILDQEFIRVPKWAIESGLLYLPKID